MQKTREQLRVGESIIVLLVLLNVLVLQCGITTNPRWYRALYVSIPLLILSVLANRKRE
jgi:hypothetical protein